MAAHPSLRKLSSAAKCSTKASKVPGPPEPLMTSARVKNQVSHKDLARCGWHGHKIYIPRPSPSERGGALLIISGDSGRGTRERQRRELRRGHQ